MQPIPSSPPPPLPPQPPAAAQGEPNIAFNQVINHEDFYCPILQKVMRHAVQLPCGHNFEEKAIKRWFETNKQRVCAVCKKECPVTPAKNLFLQNTINEWKKFANIKDEEEVEEVARPPAAAARRPLTRQEIQDKLKDISAIYKEGSDGKGVAVDMLVNLQQEYPEEEAFSNAIKTLLDPPARPNVPHQPAAQPVMMPAVSSPIPKGMIQYNGSLYAPVSLQGRGIPVQAARPPAPPHYLPSPMPPRHLPGQPMGMAPAAAQVVRSPLPIAPPVHKPPVPPPPMSYALPSPPPAPLPLVPPQSSQVQKRDRESFEAAQPSQDLEASSNAPVPAGQFQQLERAKQRAVDGAAQERIKEAFYLAQKGSYQSFKEALTEETVQAVNDKGNTLLHEVVLARREVKFLSALVERNASIDKVNAAGNTALHLATELKSFRHVKKLKELGVDLNVRNRAGKTAEEMTKSKKIRILFQEKEEGEIDSPKEIKQEEKEREKSE
jgi:hypothetical protein